MMVAENLDVKSGMTVIDVCAAPGGKTTHIAQKMNNEGKILAFDIYEHKINLIRDNYTRLGIHIIEEKIQDATLFNDEFFQIADRVLVDAPCSGFGIIRRKPEIKFSKTEDDIINLSKLQLDILNNASKYLKDDGILLYSTCSIEPLEDENVIELFLKENQNFSLLGNGNVKFFPNVDDTDGFFISKLIKRG
jgi:16S rRNA (cytosine967-C5)-methyltransferase